MGYSNRIWYETLAGLFLSDAITIKRDDRKASKPVFVLREDNFTQMIYRSGRDVSIKIHPKAQQGFWEIERFLANPDNYIEFRLAAGQILILDNTRLLHGRTSFSQNSNRKLHGLWCDGISSFSPMFTIGFQVN